MTAAEIENLKAGDLLYVVETGIDFQPSVFEFCLVYALTENQLRRGHSSITLRRTRMGGKPTERGPVLRVSRTTLRRYALTPGGAVTIYNKNAEREVESARDRLASAERTLAEIDSWASTWNGDVK